MKRNDRVIISTTITKKQYKELERIGEVMGGVPMATLIRLALAAFFKENKKIYDS